MSQTNIIFIIIIDKTKMMKRESQVRVFKREGEKDGFKLRTREKREIQEKSKVV